MCFIHDVVCRIYPPDGALPKDISDTRLLNAINTRLKVEKSNERVKPGSVRNYIKYCEEQLALASKDRRKT